MAVSFFNSTGGIDLNLIKDEDVAALDDTRKQALSILIDAVITKGKAEERHRAARERVYSAMAAEDEALRLHLAANPPQTQQEAQRAAISAFHRSH